MANNIIVKDANSSNVTMKTTETGGVHTASSIPEGEILEVLQAIRMTLNSLTKIIGNYQTANGVLQITGTGLGISTLPTVSSVTSVSSVSGITNLSQLDTVLAPKITGIFTDNIRKNITVT